MNTSYFIKFIEHSQEFYTLLEQRPSAFCLLVILVDRARKVELDLKDGLSVGEAYTGAGDAERYKATRQKYRTDLLYLQKIGQILITKTTNKGTIIRIVNSSIFDISRSKVTDEITIDQPATTQPPTTKQEDRGKKKYLISKNFDEKLGSSKDFGSSKRSVPYRNDYQRNPQMKGGVDYTDVV